MQKIIFVIASLFYITDVVFAQSEFWDGIKIRKAFETKTEDDDKAANLSFTFPKEGTNYFVINTGIGYQFGNSKKVSNKNKIFKNSFTGFFVYNRNNQIDKEQNNYKLGLSSNQVFYTDTINTFAIFGSNTIEYLRNYIDTSHSILITSYWYPFSKIPNSLKLTGYSQAESRFAYNFLPQIGIEYQNKLEAEQSEIKGYDLRSFFSIGGSFLLKKKTYDYHDLLAKKYWTKGIELTITYDGRVSIFKNIVEQDSYLPMFRTELIIYPTQDNKFSVGLSYNNGINPIEGIEKQTFWLLALKFKK
jgi:hypothetical protein